MKKIKNYISKIGLAFLLSIIFSQYTYAIPIDDLLNKDSSNLIIYKICDMYNEYDDLESFIEFGYESREKANSNNKTDALSGFKTYIIILNIINSDMNKDASCTILDRKQKLGKNIESIVIKLINKGFISNSINEVEKYYHNSFLPWAIPYIKKQCGFKF